MWRNVYEIDDRQFPGWRVYFDRDRAEFSARYTERAIGFKPVYRIRITQLLTDELRAEWPQFKPKLENA